MKKINVLSLVFLGLVRVCFALESGPVVTWASYPIKEGERVILHGGDWGDKPCVEIGKKKVDAKVLSDSGLVFPFPLKAESIVEGRVISDKGVSKPFVLNAPTVWWLQGEDGRDASAPGGLLRIFGRSLAPYGKIDGGRVRVRLGTKELSLEKIDVWSLAARIPMDCEPGMYSVFVSNGLSGGKDWYEAGTWTISVRREVWKSTFFNVIDFGAEANDDVCDSDAFDAAMSAAEKNGGGIVFVPYGRFKLTRTLVVPPHVLLKGEDRALSQIFWPDTENPPNNLIEGTHSFGIHDLFISSGQYRNGIVAKNEMSESGCMSSQRGTVTHDISLKRLRIKFISDQFREENNLQNFLPRYGMRGDGIIVRNCLRGEIEDCDIYCDKDAQRTLFFNFTGDYIRMANCRINGSGWAIFGGDRCIFENNSAKNCTYSISSVCSRMFWSGNRQTDLYTNNREAVTHDGAKTAWCVKNRGENGCAFGIANGTNVNLTYPDPEGLHWKTATNENAWVGWDLQITDGRGVGQTRTIVGMKNKNELQIDRPFDITPDASSLFVVVAERKHLIYADNDIEDAGVAIQLYGGVTDCVVARNKCRRAGGFHGSGRDYHGVIVCWYVQFLDNVIEEGNCHRGAIGTDYKGTGTSLIGAFAPNVRWPFSQTYVYKGNEIKSNGSLFISVKNALVERNTVRRSDVGVVSRRYQDTMYIADNVFDRVEMPYHNLPGAFITPEYTDVSREKYLAMIKSGMLAKRRTAIRRAFGFVVTPQPWNMAFRDVTGGRSHKPFKLPFTIKVNGVLAHDVKLLRVQIPSCGGWDFGEKMTLVKQTNEFAGEISVTPPKEGAVGMFTLPMRIITTGEDWEFETEVMVNPLSQNRFVQWQTALAEPGKQPTEWRTLAYNEGMDGHESLFPKKLWGNAISGKDCYFMTRIKVVNPTKFSFTRGDETCVFFIDGKRLIDEGIGLFTMSDVTLEPGEHTLMILYPAVSNFRRSKDSGVYLKCTFPNGCSAGDWVHIIMTNRPITKF